MASCPHGWGISETSGLAVHPLRAQHAYSLVAADLGEPKRVYLEPIMSKSRHRESCTPVGDLLVAELGR